MRHGQRNKLLASLPRGRLAAAEVCREQGVSQATFYKWKSKYSGLEVNEASSQATEEVENAKPAAW